MGTHSYAYVIEAARIITNIEAAITSALFDISDHSARHENGGADVLSLAGLAVAIGDVTGHDKALHDGLNINADQVDGEEAAAIVTNVRVKAHFPDIIANILSDHDKAAHDALGIAPAAHTIDKHTDVTRKLFLDATRGYTDGAISAYGAWAIVKLDANADEYIAITFKIPSDYASGGSIKFLYVDNGCSGNVIWDTLLYHGIDGESVSGNSSSDNGNTLTISGDSNLHIVSTTLSFTTLSKNDFVGLAFTRDADNASDNYLEDFNVAGFIFEYTAEQ